jgi:hypothetical protein
MTGDGRSILDVAIREGNMDLNIANDLIVGGLTFLGAVLGAIVAVALAKWQYKRDLKKMEKQYKQEQDNLKLQHEQHLQIVELQYKQQQQSWEQQQLGQMSSDKRIFQSWYIAFNRPAFKGPYNYRSEELGLKPGEPSPFRRAIADTIQAVTTGVRVNRSGMVLGRGGGIDAVSNPDWRTKMQGIERRLNRISRVLQGLEKLDNQTPGEVIDYERDEIIKTLNEIFRVLEIDELPLPTLGDYEDAFPRA